MAKFVQMVTSITVQMMVDDDNGNIIEYPQDRLESMLHMHTMGKNKELLILDSSPPQIVHTIEE